VHVTELIGKQPRPLDRVDCVDPVDTFAFDANHPLDASALDSLLDPESQPCSHRRPPSKGAQVAKIAGLGLASFALCASIALGSVITHHRREGAAEATRPAMDISGEQALLPDLLNRAVPDSGMTGRPALAGDPTVATGTIDNPGPTRRQPPPPVSTPDTGSTQPSADDTVSKTELVERFYRLAPGDPDRAFGLLDSTLLGTDLDKFVRSWSGVRDVQVLDVHEQGDNVLAVVRLRLQDGSYLRVRQLLDVANTLPRRIVGAEILSAQRN
jgi:hypothetical protein